MFSGFAPKKANYLVDYSNRQAPFIKKNQAVFNDFLGIGHAFLKEYSKLFPACFVIEFRISFINMMYYRACL